MQRNTPPINATGTYLLAEPFVAEPDAIYVCEAIEGFEALEAEDIDVFETIYAPNGISSDRFEQDRLNGIDIVTLMSDTAQTIKLPSSYILSFPSTQSVKYGETLIVVNCGLLPYNIATGPLLNELKEIASAMTGTKPTARVHVSAVKDNVDYDRHIQLEQARQTEIKYSESIAKQLADSRNTISELENRIEALQEIIVNLQP